MMAILDSAVVMPRTCAVADQVLLLDTVGSTNTYAADLVREGVLFGVNGADGVSSADGVNAGKSAWSGHEIVVIAANERPYVDERSGGVVHRVAGGKRARFDYARFVRQWLAADDRRLRDA